MASSFTWLDYSEQDRRKMLDVISLFREQTTRDELGIGIIRDAFADLFFPGTSTIQTRARYFLFIPWLYQDLIARKTPAQKIDQKLRQREVALIEALAQSDDSRGTIGIVARAGLKRLPSDIYWNGLKQWGIRGAALGAQSDYNQNLDAFRRSLHSAQSDDEMGEDLPLYDWDPYLPAPPDTFPDTAAFQLTQAEAKYLVDRILHCHPRSLLAYLVDQQQPLEFDGFIWEHPHYHGLPDHLRGQLFHAQNFSETIQGAALLYNLMLAEEKRDETLTETYRHDLQQWAERLNARQSNLEAWSREDYWELVTQQAGPQSPRTVGFLNQWFDLALPLNRDQIADHPHARNLIRDREGVLKRGNARLGNPRALDLWQGGAGTAPLDFRWKAARNILTDILNGLLPEETAHVAA